MRKKKNRDDFSSTTINALRRRAGNRCSNPACRVPTDGPSDTGPEKINNIGEAAHITAAAEGGPRYNKALKPEDRRSIENGIWLCANCAGKIDRDEKTYTVALLHEWKEKAEESAKREQGKKLPDERDTINQLAAVLTGQSGKFFPNLMANASKATSSCFETVDLRFTVETSFHRGVTHYVIHPKEIVSFKITANQPHVKEVAWKFNELIKHGRNIAIDVAAVKFEGLPIVEKLLENFKGVVRLENLERRNIILRIKTVSPDSREESFFYDLHGYAVLGTESIRIEAHGLDGLVSINIKLPISGGVGEVTFTVNFKLWDNSQLNAIQYFDRIYQLHYEIINNWKLNISAEAGGMHLFSSYCDDYGAFSDRFKYLNLIKMAREISKKIKYQLYYNSSFELTGDDYSKIEEFYEVLTSGLYKFPFKETIHISLKLNDYGVEMLNYGDSESKLFSIKVEQEKHEKITLFGQELTLPKLSRTITIVEPKVVNSKHDDIKSGDLIELELIPADNCECILEKLPDARSN